MKRLLPLLGLASVAATSVTITSSTATQSSFTYGVSISTDGLFDGTVEPGPARWSYSGSISVASKSVPVSGEAPIPHPPVDDLLRDGPELRVQSGESLTLEGGDRYYNSITIDGTLTVTAHANFYVRGRVRFGKNATVNAAGSTFVQGSCSQASDDVDDNAEENQFRVQGSVTARIEAPDSRVRIVKGASFTGEIAGREVRVQGTVVGSIFAKRSLEIDGLVQGDVRCLGNIVVRGRLEGTATAGGTITGATGNQHVPFAFTIVVTWDSSGVAESIYSATLALSIRRGTVTLGSATATSSVTVDRTPPVLTLSPSGPIADRTPTLTAAWSDAVAGVDVATFRATLDGEDVTPSFSNGSWTTGELPDGVHTFAARIADRVGNVAQTSVQFHVVTALASIGTSGGTLSVDDPASPIAGATLEVPEGAMPMAVTFTIELISTPAAFPPGFVSSGPVVDFNPSIEFLAPVTVAIPYGALPPGVPERGVRLLRWDLVLREWVLVPILRVDEERNLVYAQVTRLAGVQFGVAGQIADAARSVVTATATVPADGTSFATVVITPEDIEGLLLGPNQDVSVVLQGVGTASPVMDLGNGAYQAFVVSTVVGLSQVRATVNGVELASQPVIRLLNAAPDFFALEVTSPVQAGQASNLTITAKLFSGEVLATFSGTVEIHLTGTAGFYPQVLAVTFTPDDLGILTLPNALVFARAGVQQLKVTYPVKPTVGGFAQIVVLKGPAVLVEKFAGDNQTGAPSTQLPEPLVARVTDLFGNPIEGVTVDFLSQGGAAFVTGSSGPGGEATISRIAGGVMDGYPATEVPLPLGIQGENNALDVAICCGPDALFVAIPGQHRVRKIDSQGIVSTAAGFGTPGSSGDGGLAIEAQFYMPMSVISDGSGGLFVADTFNHVVRRIGSDGMVFRHAGNGEYGPGGDGGPALSAQITAPLGLALDGLGRLYILDSRRSIRRVEPDGTITSVFSVPPGFPPDEILSMTIHESSLFFSYRSFTTFGSRIKRMDLESGIVSDFVEIPSEHELRSIASDAQGYLYVCGMNRILKVSPTAEITTFAGGMPGSSAEGTPALEAWISSPRSVAVDSFGQVFFVDGARIRRVDVSGLVWTVAGNGTYTYGKDGIPAVDATIAGAISSFDAGAIAFDTSANLYLADTFNNVIRRVDASSGLITTLAGNGSPVSTGDGGPAIQAQLHNPGAIAVDPAGAIYFFEQDFSSPMGARLRKIGTDGAISTVWTGANIAGGMARPTLAAAADGTIFIGAPGLRQVLRFDPATGTTEVFAADVGEIASISLAPTGTLFIAEVNGRISKLSNGAVEFVAMASSSPRPPQRPLRIAADGAERVYFDFIGEIFNPNIGLDYYTLIRRVEADGSLSTVAGNGVSDGKGDGGPAALASISGVTALAMDPSGYLCMIDTPVTFTTAARIRRITFGGGGGPATSPSASALTDARGLAVSPSLLLPSAPGAFFIDATAVGSGVTFSINAGGPGPAAPAITSPADDATILTATPIISGTAPTGATVVVLADGLQIGSDLSDGTWSITALPLSTGAHTLTAYVAGSTASAPVDIVVSLTPPDPPTITTAPKKTSSTQPRVEGYSAPFITVVVFADGLEVGSTFSDAGGNWSLTTSALPDGAFTITAATRTSALSAPSDAIAIVVDTVPPDAPTNLAASEGNGMVFLTWDASLASDTMGYFVWRKLASDPDSSYTKLHLLPVIGTQYCDNTVTNDVQYCYRVVAADDAIPEEAP